MFFCVDFTMKASPLPSPVSDIEMSMAQLT